MEERGEIHFAKITIFHTDTMYDGRPTSGGEMVGSNIAETMTLNLTKATKEEVEGRIVAPKGTKMLDKSVSGEMSFHAPVGDDRAYARNPISTKELITRITRLADNAAGGTLKVDGQNVPLKYAYAYLEKNPFDRKRKDTVVMLSDRALPAESVMKKSMGDAQGVVISIDDTKATGHLSIYHPAFPNGAQISGSGGMAGYFDPADMTAGAISGRLYSGADQDFFDKKFSFEADFRTPVTTINDPTDFYIDASNGTRLPKSGGDPGKTYLAYDKAIRSGKFENLVKFKAAGSDVPDPSTMSAEDKKMAAKMMEFMKLMRPSSIKITDGYTKGDQATLLVQGPSTSEKGATDYGTILMLREKGQWRIVNEAWSNTRD